VASRFRFQSVTAPLTPVPAPPPSFVSAVAMARVVMRISGALLISLVCVDSVSPSVIGRDVSTPGLAS
jgi:hypothetical protein